jgi:hypothetical protein
MREFMKLKENEKNELEKINLDKGDEDKMRTSKNGWKDAREKASTAVSLDKVETYEEAFAKIEAATGIHDIDTLVTNFIQAEEKVVTKS